MPFTFISEVFVFQRMEWWKGLINQTIVKATDHILCSIRISFIRISFSREASPLCGILSLRFVLCQAILFFKHRKRWRSRAIFVYPTTILVHLVMAGRTEFRQFWKWHIFVRKVHPLHDLHKNMRKGAYVRFTFHLDRYQVSRSINLFYAKSTNLR